MGCPCCESPCSPCSNNSCAYHMVAAGVPDTTAPGDCASCSGGDLVLFGDSNQNSANYVYTTSLAYLEIQYNITSSGSDGGGNYTDVIQKTVTIEIYCGTNSTWTIGVNKQASQTRTYVDEFDNATKSISASWNANHDEYVIDGDCTPDVLTAVVTAKTSEVEFSINGNTAYSLPYNINNDETQTCFDFVTSSVCSDTVSDGWDDSPAITIYLREACGGNPFP